MIKSQRTKRRKIRNDLALFDINPLEIYPRIELITTDNELIRITKESLPCQSIQNNDTLVLKPEVEPFIFTGPTLTEIINQSESDNIKDFISSWAIQYKIPHNALSRLLSWFEKTQMFPNPSP